MALVEALGNVSKEYAQSAAASVKQALTPSMAKTFASMGSLGGVLKDVSDEMKALKDKEKGRDKAQEKGQKQNSEMIALLKEIKKIQLQQLALMSGGGAAKRTAELEASLESGAKAATQDTGKGYKEPSTKTKLAIGFGGLAGAIAGLGIMMKNDMLPGIRKVAEGISYVYNNFDKVLETFKQSVAGIATAIAGYQIAKSQMGLGGGRGGATGQPPVSGTGRTPSPPIPTGPAGTPQTPKPGDRIGSPQTTSQDYLGGMDKKQQPAGKTTTVEESKSKPTIKDRIKAATTKEPPKSWGGKWLSRAGRVGGAALGAVGAAASAAEGDWVGAALQGGAAVAMMAGGPPGWAIAAGLTLVDMFRNKGDKDKKASIAGTSNDPLINKIAGFIGMKEGGRGPDGLFREYLDAAKKPTIGYGHLLKPDEMSSGKIKIGSEDVDYRNGLTEEQAQALMKQDISKHMDIVRKAFGSDFDKFNDDQKAALTSFAYNVGKIPGELVDAIKGGDDQAVRKIMGKYNKITDKSTGEKIPLKGLTARRTEEAALVTGKTTLAQLKVPGANVANISPNASPGKNINAQVAETVVTASDRIAQSEFGDYAGGGMNSYVDNSVRVVNAGGGGSQGPVAIPSAKGGSSYGAPARA